MMPDDEKKKVSKKAKKEKLVPSTVTVKNKKSKTNDSKINSSTKNSKNRFILINDILCCTETSDGSFRPSDIFVGLDPPPKETLLLGNSSPTNRDVNLGTNTGGVHRDCCIFTTFGILSGGVLIDPNSQKFVDFIDDIIIKSTIYSEEENNNKNNNKYYESLSYSNIKGEGIFSLCSSIEPFNTSGTKRTPLSWPKSTFLTSSVDADWVARRNTRYMISRCIPGIKINSKVLYLLEKFRCHRKCTRPQSTFTTIEIPFRFQYAGKEFLLQNNNNNNNNNNNSNNVTKSIYSEFHCFTGLIAMGCPRYLRGDPNKGCSVHAARIELIIQQLLRPLRENIFISKLPPREKLKEISEVEKSWFIFWRYFNILQIQASPKPNKEGRTEWSLADDKDVNYKKNIKEFETNLRNSKSGKVDLYTAVDAWDWLITHNRMELLHRIRKLNRYLMKLQN